MLKLYILKETKYKGGTFAAENDSSRFIENVGRIFKSEDLDKFSEANRLHDGIVKQVTRYGEFIVYVRCNQDFTNGEMLMFDCNDDFELANEICYRYTSENQWEQEVANRFMEMFMELRENDYSSFKGSVELDSSPLP